MRERREDCERLDPLHGHGVVRTEFGVESSDGSEHLARCGIVWRIVHGVHEHCEAT